MTTKDVGKNAAKSLLDEVRELALVVGEDCPEGHRRDPGSGRCLPMGSTDHTKFTRSVNNDDGPQWRGEVDKTNTTFAAKKEAAIDADQMDEPQSCAAGTTFSFIQRKCVTLEEAEAEIDDTFAIAEDGTPLFEDEAVQPVGRRDTPNHECPANEFFDYKRRECIPLNKDTVLASESVDTEFKKAVAMHLSGKLGVTSPDPVDGHYHLVTVDDKGNGTTSLSTCYCPDGESFTHSHEVSDYLVKDYTYTEKEEGEKSESRTSRHFGHVIPKHLWEFEDHSTDSAPVPVAGSEDAENKEAAAPLKGGQRKALPDSVFGVPGKRKFPLDTCARVRNAMARFNQGKGLTPGEKAALRRKILSRAKACGIKVESFGKANTEAEFAAVVQELIAMETPNTPTENTETAERMKAYEAAAFPKQGPCPPGMTWDPAAKKCGKLRGFVEEVANHSEIISKQPEGRRDPVGFQCPAGSFFDFGDRKCVPLDPSKKPGTTTTQANEEEDAAKRNLPPQPAGRPARLPQDCPAGTIWDADLEDCKPLDSRKKTKSAEEESQTTPNGPGKSGPGCPEGQFMNPVTKKCMPRKGAFQGKSASESAGREGLTEEVPGKVKLPVDCPAGTIWDGNRRTCTPLDSRDKNRPNGGANPMNPKDVATMSTAQLIQVLDEILKEQVAKEKSRVAAKELPNAAFPPSLISPTHRSLMHHTPDVSDPYDSASVDVARLRNALYRTSKVEGFSEKAVEDAIGHLLFHAREIVEARLTKKD